MDKQTLSNYGWLVIVTLILAVMLALATPFGTYVGDAVVSVANGYVGASNNAMGDDNISNMEQQWFDKLGTVSSELETVIAGATFSDGTFLTWDELKLAENGVKYGYTASAISDTSIGVAAFDNCWDLTNIVIHSSVTTIGDSAFGSCEKLTNVVILNGVSVIDNYAFTNCINLKSITISDSVTTIGNSAFEASESLETINFTGDKTTWNKIYKGTDWNHHVAATVVHCTDGDITL